MRRIPWRGFVILGFFFLLSQEASALLFKKPWCDRALSRTPREIQIFREDMKLARQLSTRKDDGQGFGTLNLDYPQKFIAAIDKVFSTTRYTNLSPEIRARLISYLLLKTVRMTHPRSLIINHMSQWLIEQLDRYPFGLEDLERLRLSFGIFMNRRATLLDRNNPWLELSLTIGADGALSVGAWLIFDLFRMLSHGLIGFGPLPACFLVRAIWLAAFHWKGDKLDDGARAAISNVDRKFIDLIGGHLKAKEFLERWNENLAGIVRKNGAEIRPGIVLENIREFSELAKRIYVHHPADTIELFAHMARSLERVNPIDWMIVRDSFIEIRETLRRLGVAESEANHVFGAMRAVAHQWKANAAARKSVDDLLGKPQELPEQTPSP
jgi:hypothetical protein